MKQQAGIFGQAEDQHNFATIYKSHRSLGMGVIPGDSARTNGQLEVPWRHTGLTLRAHCLLVSGLAGELLCAVPE